VNARGSSYFGSLLVVQIAEDDAIPRDQVNFSYTAFEPFDQLIERMVRMDRGYRKFSCF
jgi:hypothetical protein